VNFKDVIEIKLNLGQPCAALPHLPYIA